MHHIGLQVLRAKLRGFNAAGHSITAHISKATGARKHALWDAKRRLGTHCRYHLIAYGLLRGVPYDKIEQCAYENLPSSQAILDIMLAHADGQQKQGLDLERVRKLLGTWMDVAAAPAAASVPSSRQTVQQQPGLFQRALELLRKTA